MKIKHCSDIQNTTRISKTLLRGLCVLMEMTEDAQPIGVRELARRLDLNPGIVQRLLNTLALCNFVEQVPQTQRYQIGHTAFEVGRAFVSSGGLVEVAQPILQQLAMEHEINTFLGIRDGNECLYLIAQQSPGPLSVRASVGSRIPLHTTAMGKMLLSVHSNDAIRTILKGAGLIKQTEKSKIDIEELVEEISEARKSGFAISNEENLPGVYSVGGIIRGPEQDCLAAISCACPSYDADQAQRRKMTELIQETAIKISSRFGAPLPDTGSSPEFQDVVL